jgi:Flp pilus assembly protein TadG
MIRILRQFARQQQGLAVVEFALALPFLMTMFYGCIEVTRFILITQKVEKMAHSAADVTAQSKVLTGSGMNQILAATNDIMQPFATGANSRVLISSLYRPQGVANATVNWRHCGGGGLISTSHLGSVGATPVMPGTFTFNERENVIAAEVFYQFSPLISNEFFGTTTVYRVAFYKPRLGLLTSTPAGITTC